MKRFLTLSMCLILLTACSSAYDYAAEAQQYRRYGLEQGEIRYRVIGLENGEETLRWKHWGLLESRRKNASGVADLASDDLELGTTVRELNLIKEGYSYGVDLNQNTGIKLKNTFADFLEAEEATTEGGTPPLVSVLMLEALGAIKTGEKRIFSEQECEVWTLEASLLEVCLWEGIPLEQILGSGNNRVVSQAVLIEELPSFTDGEFDLPAGVVLEDLSDQVAEAANQAESVGDSSDSSSESAPELIQ